MPDTPSNRQVSVSASSSASVSTSSQPPQVSKSTHVEARVGDPVEYKVIDQPWSPTDPAATEAMLTEIGQDGWRLITVYPDHVREKTRWVFNR